MNASILIRRTHMYLALFFVPWVVVYSLSTLFFNHGIRQFTGNTEGRPIMFEKESEQIYSRTFPEGTPPRRIGEQILADLRLSGTFGANRRRDGKVVINRQDPLTPRRVTYAPDTGTLLVERQVMSMPTWLRTIHHRAGFGHEEVVEDGWALSVDLAILAMLFWAFSGVWMWWELKKTRKWGLILGAFGIALFTFLVLAL